MDECIFKTKLANVLIQVEDKSVIQICFTKKKIKLSDNLHLINAKKQGTINLKHFSFDAMEVKLGEIIKNHVPEFPREVKFKMPGIKKIALPKMKTL